MRVALIVIVPDSDLPKSNTSFNNSFMRLVAALTLAKYKLFFPH